MNEYSRYYSKKDCLEHLLTLEVLKDLSMVEWKLLLEDKEGLASGVNLYKILDYKIKNYDTKYFFYKKKEWFDSETRASLKNLLQSISEITLILGNDTLILSKDKALQFIEDLELYSYECKVNRVKHIQKLKELRTIEDLLNYNLTEGYPEPLKLEDYL